MKIAIDNPELKEINKELIDSAYKEYYKGNLNKVKDYDKDDLIKILYVSAKSKLSEVIRFKFGVTIPDGILLSLPIILGYEKYKEVMRELL